MERAVRWVMRLERIDASGRVLETSEIGSIARDGENPTAADFGLRLAEGKAILEQLQLRMTQQQVDAAVAMNRRCAGCGSRRSIHDYQTRTVQTLFGKVVVKLPRLRHCGCHGVGPKPGCADYRLPIHTTPELDNVMAELGARHSFREAARLLDLFLPTSSVANHTAVRKRLGKVAARTPEQQDAIPHEPIHQGAGLGFH